MVNNYKSDRDYKSMSALVYMAHQSNIRYHFDMIPYIVRLDTLHNKGWPDKSDLKDTVVVEYVFHKLLLLLQKHPTESRQNILVTDQLVQVPDLLEMVVGMGDKMAVFPVEGYILDLVE